MRSDRAKMLVVPASSQGDLAARGIISIETKGAISSRRAPGHWAAFVLSGDWR